MPLTCGAMPQVGLLVFSIATTGKKELTLAAIVNAAAIAFYWGTVWARQQLRARAAKAGAAPSPPASTESETDSAEERLS